MIQTSRLREWDDVNALLHPMQFQMQKTSMVLRGEVDGGGGASVIQCKAGGARPSKHEAGTASKQERRDAFGVKLALEALIIVVST
jgi:hypothetical protein